MLRTPTDPFTESEIEETTVPTKTDFAALERAGTRAHRRAKAEDKADALAAADGVPLSETRLAKNWKEILSSAADKLEADDLEEYRRKLDTVHPKKVLVAAALLEELGPKPPALAAPALHKRWANKARIVARVGTYFGKFTFGQIGKKAVAGYWAVCSAMRIAGGENDPKYLSYGQTKADLEFLRRALRNYAADNGLVFAPTFEIPRENVIRTLFLTRGEVAAMIWAARGRYRDRQAGDWLKMKVEPTTEEAADPGHANREPGRRYQLHKRKWYVNEGGRLWRLVNFIDETARKHRKGLIRALLIEIYAGLRHESCRRLKHGMSREHGWIDVERRTIHRAGTAHPSTSKTLTPTTVMNDRLTQHAARWERADARDGFQFVIRKFDGSPYSSLNGPFNKTVEAAGLDPEVVVHTFRHTLATWLCIMGVDRNSAAAYLGMSPDTLEKVYRHFSPTNALNAVEAWRDPAKVAKLKGTKVSRELPDDRPLRAEHRPEPQRPRRVATPVRIREAFAQHGTA